MSEALVGSAAEMACDAWRRSGRGRDPRSVVALKERAEREVFRLVGAGSGGSDVVAKRCDVADAARERVVYQQILAPCPQPTLRYYGRFGAGARAWLFVEYADGAPFDAGSRAHRELAGRWLAALHRTAAGRAAPPGLPMRDAPYYRGVVIEAREALNGAKANPALSRGDAFVVDRLMAHAVRLLDTWEARAAALRSLPDTIVHNDFWKGNVRVRAGAEGETLLPFDWGAAGWGSPAVDLAVADLHAYRAEEGRAGTSSWPRTTEALATGVVLRVLGAIPGEAHTLASTWPHRALRKLRAYVAELDAAASPCRA